MLGGGSGMARHASGAHRPFEPVVAEHHATPRLPTTPPVAKAGRGITIRCAMHRPRRIHAQQDIRYIIRRWPHGSAGASGVSPSLLCGSKIVEVPLHFAHVRLHEVLRNDVLAPMALVGESCLVFGALHASSYLSTPYRRLANVRLWGRRLRVLSVVTVASVRS